MIYYITEYIICMSRMSKTTGCLRINRRDAWTTSAPAYVALCMRCTYRHTADAVIGCKPATGALDDYCGTLVQKITRSLTRFPAVGAVLLRSHRVKNARAPHATAIHYNINLLPACVCACRDINERPKTDRKRSLGRRTWRWRFPGGAYIIRLSTRQMIYHADGDKQSIQSYRIPSPPPPPFFRRRRPSSSPRPPLHSHPARGRILSPFRGPLPPAPQQCRPKANYELIGARGIYKFKRNFYIYIIRYYTLRRAENNIYQRQLRGPRDGAVGYLWDNVTDGLYFRSRTGPT